MLKTLLLIEFFYVLPGIGLGCLLFGRAVLPARAKVALTLFVSLLAVPYCAGWIALTTGRLVRLQILIDVAIVLTLAFVVWLWRWFKNLHPALPKLEDLLLLAVAGLTAWFYAGFHTTQELLFQLYSWIVRDDAYCFYLMIFRSMAAPGLPVAQNLDAIHSIIATPGNVPWPAAALALFFKHGMLGVHAAFAASLAAFAYLSGRHVLRSRFYGLVAAACAAFNPLVLDTPVLDRNFMALAAGAALFYLLISEAAAPLALGLLLGLVSGMGLRFLPALMALPVLLALYQRRELKLRPLLLLALGFLITFSINVRHLLLYPPLPGGQGEELALLARPPFVPYPNLLYVPLTVLAAAGALAGALIALGALRLYREKRKLLWLLLSFLVPVYLVLALQANWLESDKTRIFMTLIFPLALLFTCGLAALVSALRRLRWKPILAFVALTPLLLWAPRLAERIEFQTTDFYARWKMLYAAESDEYHELLLHRAAPVGLLPDYRRLDRELDARLKRGLEALNQHFLFYVPPKMTRFIALYYHWDLLYADDQGLPPAACAGEPTLLRINLARLTEQGGFAVEPVSEVPADGRIIDLSDPLAGDMLYFDEIAAEWQEQPLPISVHIEQPPYSWSDQRSTVIDLNLYRQKTGDLGLSTISLAGAEPQHLADRGQPGPSAPQAESIPYIPVDAADGWVYLKVNAGCPLVVRNWLVNLLNSTVFRIDSFEIEWTGSTPTGTRFRFNEPRFYL